MAAPATEAKGRFWKGLLFQPGVFHSWTPLWTLLRCVACDLVVSGLLAFWIEKVSTWLVLMPMLSSLCLCGGNAYAFFTNVKYFSGLMRRDKDWGHLMDLLPCASSIMRGAGAPLVSELNEFSTVLSNGVAHLIIFVFLNVVEVGSAADVFLVSCANFIQIFLDFFELYTMHQRVRTHWENLLCSFLSMYCDFLKVCLRALLLCGWTFQGGSALAACRPLLHLR
mmetsp:Transcript_8663/g.15595  ORF Transcript_8663/g.15595 Transcript_8663/m.15595 type:complete len:224 (-) Transcript_8663:158-829(-)